MRAIYNKKVVNIVRLDNEKCKKDGRSPLTRWEDDFIDSVSDQLKKGHPVTQKQDSILDRIFEKLTTTQSNGMYFLTPKKIDLKPADASLTPPPKKKYC